jgi:5-methylcytosine-specific restriction endonuclease McrBC GTP-binding regulatory subunit McrB
MPVGAITGAVGLYAANKSSKAAKDSTNAQTSASNATIAEQKRQYDLSRSDQMPWLNTGKWALGQQEAALKGDYSGFQNSPDYAFALSEGFKGLDRSAAAKGRMYSGGYGEDLTRFGQGLATQNYQGYMNNLGRLSNTGQGAAQNLGGLGQNYANAFGTAQGNIANARTSAYNTQANNSIGLAGGFGNLAADWWGGQNKSMNGGWYLGSQPGKG